MMDDNQFLNLLKRVRQLTVSILSVAILLFAGVVYYVSDPSLSIFKMEADDQVISTVAKPLDDAIENGIHLKTGLKEGDGLMLVVQNCTSCHSAKMIIQNRASKEGWKSMIKWMQQTQNLWDLGDNEEKIISYLAANYPPQRKGRRAPLTDIDWYELED